MKHIQRQQFSFTKTSIKVSLKILVNVKDDLEARKSLKARIITKYSLERFLSICGEKMSKGFLKFYKVISNLILGQIIVSNLTNVHKPNGCINYARLHYIKKSTNIKYNNDSGLPFEIH